MQAKHSRQGGGVLMAELSRRVRRSGADVGNLDWIGPIVSLLTEFHRFNQDATVHQVVSFLLIAAGNGKVTQSDVLKGRSINPAGQSKIIAMLGQRSVSGRPQPWGLVSSRPDLSDRRRAFLHLTTEGRTLLNVLEGHVTSAGQKAPRPRKKPVAST